MSMLTVSESADPDPKAKVVGAHHANPVVETRGWTKRYGARIVVDTLDMPIPAGVVAGFIGPNGRSTRRSTRSSSTWTAASSRPRSTPTTA